MKIVILLISMTVFLFAVKTVPRMDKTGKSDNANITVETIVKKTNEDKNDNVEKDRGKDGDREKDKDGFVDQDKNGVNDQREEDFQKIKELKSKHKNVPDKKTPQKAEPTKKPSEKPSTPKIHKKKPTK